MSCLPVVELADVGYIAVQAHLRFCGACILTGFHDFQYIYPSSLPNPQHQRSLPLVPRWKSKSRIPDFNGDVRKETKWHYIWLSIQLSLQTAICQRINEKGRLGVGEACRLLFPKMLTFPCFFWTCTWRLAGNKVTHYLFPCKSPLMVEIQLWKNVALCLKS